MRVRVTVLLTGLATLLLSGCPAVHGLENDAGMGSDGWTATTDVPTFPVDVPADAPRVDVPADAPDLDVPSDAPRVFADASGSDVPGASLESGRVRCVETGAWCERPSVCCQMLGGTGCSAAAECPGAVGLCDGPEDCGAGELCLLSAMEVPGWVAIYTGTRCVGPDVPVGPFGAHLCHTDGDCPAGVRCCELLPDSPGRCGSC